MGKEIVNLHIGGCGINIGEKLWNLFEIEHNVDNNDIKSERNNTNEKAPYTTLPKNVKNYKIYKFDKNFFVGYKIAQYIFDLIYPTKRSINELPIGLTTCPV